MKGSIRAGVGFLVVFGAVGGLDSDPSVGLLVPMVLAICGLALMYSGVSAMKGVK